MIISNTLYDNAMFPTGSEQMNLLFCFITT